MAPSTFPEGSRSPRCTEPRIHCKTPRPGDWTHFTDDLCCVLYLLGRRVCGKQGQRFEKRLNRRPRRAPPPQKQQGDRMESQPSSTRQGSGAQNPELCCRGHSSSLLFPHCPCDMRETVQGTLGHPLRERGMEQVAPLSIAPCPRQWKLMAESLLWQRFGQKDEWTGQADKHPSPPPGPTGILFLSVLVI